MVRVLVVEDEVGLAQSLQDGLSDHGYSVQVTHDGFSGYRLAKESEFDLIVLDWMLPGMSGVEMCQRLRSEDVAVPILILTSKDATSDETDALELGADDYLRKPFTFGVLVARCDALLRRGSGSAGWAELIVGEQAVVNGSIAADSVRVFGQVNGAILGASVVLHPSAQVEGDIHSQSLTIEQGASFDGRSRKVSNPAEVAPQLDMQDPQAQAYG